MVLFKYKDYVNQFISESKENIYYICKIYSIYNYTINEDGSVDVNGDVYLYNKGLDKLPLRFGKVTGHFYCENNRLTSLEGCPSKVGGSFHCNLNKLTSLEGCPIEVCGDFYCSFNKLTSLEGGPIEVGSDFDCSYNKLNSLEGSPSEVGGFDCSNNKIVDVKGFPRIIGGYIYMDYNPVYAIFKLFPKENWLEVSEYLNEYNVIRDGNKVVMQALEVVYDELGLEVPDEIYIEGYEII